MTGVQAVFHAATLHKPHVATHSRQAFIDTNITGTLNLLEEAVAADVGAFVFTSSTSVFGDALVPPPGAPAAWVTEEVRPIPEEHLWRHQGGGRGPLPAVPQEPGAGVRRPQNLAIFPEEDDNEVTRETYAADNAKANEFLFRRVDLEDAVSAHLLAAERAAAIGLADT